MEQIYIEDKIFEKLAKCDFSLENGVYDNCRFVNCDFSESDFSEFKFIDCEFSNCNLSLLKLNKTVFNEVSFNVCKMLGIHFDDCSEFSLSFSFDNCQLNHSSFYNTKIRNTLFKDSQLHEVDFSECDLSESVFDNCDFMNATFDNTNLEKTDLRTSINYSLDPENNRIKKAKFSMPAVVGLLDKYNIRIEK